MDALILKNATLLDLSARDRLEGRHIVIESRRIKEVSDRPIVSAAVRSIDLKGRTVLPGLIDLHVHVMATQLNLGAQPLVPNILVALKAVPILKGMLHRGFTTVRDAGGAGFALKNAIEEGIVDGPRLFVAGKSLSQTAGNGDTRMRLDYLDPGCPCCSRLGALSRICDGVDGVLRATREEFKMGADHIKVMASGGVSSPTDSIGTLGFSTAELSAIVGEATARGSYVMAHAYSAAAIRHAVTCGVRTIEHGNLVDGETAALMAARQVYAVPTLATFAILTQYGDRYDLSPSALAKLASVRDAGFESLDTFQRHGVRMGYGTDLLGESHVHQNEEFSLRARVLSPWDIIESATTVGAEVLGMQGQIGVVAPGAFADLVVVNGSPIDDIQLLARPDEGMAAAMKAGAFVRSSL
jgi:imidazolonepropionase-like amidohydrolase